MASYLCENCKWNNNGWCKKLSMNGLKKKNIQECKEYAASGTMLVLEREGKDYYGQEMVLIKINSEVVSLPISIIEQFINDKEMRSQEVRIPD